MNNKKARVIAYYLPQFHPTPENDKFWGKGFTEWTNVGKAKPLFKGHEQPRVPADLGYYDLRMPEIRKQQAELAKEAGIEGFCYWHYWFGNGKMFLQDIFDDVVKSKEPDFPFCIGWANHSWSTKSWTNSSKKAASVSIAEQTYPGDEDYIAHFYYLLEAFKDPRYIKVDDKLLFTVFRPTDIPDCKHFIELWNNLAQKEGLNGFHFVGIEHNFLIYTPSLAEHYKRDGLFVKGSELFKRVLDLGFDGINSRGLSLAHYRCSSIVSMYLNRILRDILGIKRVEKYKFRKVSKLMFSEEDRLNNVYPTIVPNWDRSPRSGKNAIVWYNNHPDYFREQVELALEYIKDKPDEHKILFLMSWNEWGEGNYMEPDITFGKGYIEALRKAIEG